MSQPQNVGIKALEIYVPSRIVNQAELEKHDGVAAGKYTIGLGQTNMAFVDDREDIYSFALTAVSRLLKNNNIDPASIGRIEVGTETLLDKSKSVKSVLMQLFGENSNIEGVDNVNACYGGTNALFNAINWVEGRSWDGRNAIVVAGDIALYAKGAARPTGGAGCVAMLIGPDAPLVLDNVHGSYFEHAYDFYKPDLTSEYPYVDGHYSLTCYTKALDKAYAAYNARAEKVGLFKDSDKKGADRFDYSAFHVPTCKLVTKSYARLLYNDYLNDKSLYEGQVPEEVAAVSYDASLTDKTVEKTFLGIAKAQSAERMAPSLQGPTNTGNMYTASVYASLISLLTFVPAEQLQGKRISLFSYGSGLASTLFSLTVKGDISPIVKACDFKAKLDDRSTETPVDYEAATDLREKAHLKKNFEPQGDIKHIKSGVYYLTNIDDMFRRKYEIKQ
ncbi:hydroxymethylglutaryl-coenzyme A synthase C terminal-domain-containing protein [Yarrowia lipolytica]|uniref:Hydroxymethylglutaryl-CoA synthase n=2 Tax=Yarrowia lipolytica TaxID=4952 RepID=Q6BZW0_YARLI|nr:YALI0F30481p [Yarrowia lipolytica CLIB122]AOW07912.1 hypothetical protein YALI1_F38116g [Yarrowia lipolytica]KAB8282302.1 hydroxymethylglutaryl-coenzyme A synthase C terminal-domain-containing protein [Yarrowia lipolytica]KAE8172312.1 hydroxymethylglutaryl-coenzyme A synthase C terminal-domain-containing protein [Yarrowia lipolytica]KAJ8055054.1 hydroxymethylglutaryl-coenzyme A synthase C terminal-domain-containing protein [Yarrowia lipolytica]QNP99522.1 Hydroxymethylglutaryl-CoA synthase [|eukprot:XP_506052.1 YALI0F30481p [Yarrowia lipolytica CLIB122]